MSFWKKFPENIPDNGHYFVKVKTRGRGIYTGTDDFGNQDGIYIGCRGWSEFKNVKFWAKIPPITSN